MANRKLASTKMMTKKGAPPFARKEAKKEEQVETKNKTPAFKSGGKVKKGC